MARRRTPFAPILALLSLLAVILATLISPVPSSAQTDQQPFATLNITFKGCPPGGDTSGPPAGCVETVDAPESAMVTAAPDWVQPVREAQRNADGSYTIPYVSSGAPGAESLGLVNFFPQDFNYYTFDGVDILTRWYGGVDLVQGETREVTVYYWNGPGGLIVPAENALVVNVSTCGDGIDPNVDPSGCVPATGDMPGVYVGTAPLRDIHMEDYLIREGGTFTYSGLPAYTQAQVVVDGPLAGYAEVLVTGQAEVIEDDSATAFLLRNERRVIDVYLYAPDDAGRSFTLTRETPEPGTGTLRLLLLSCPPGVIPHDDPARCTEAITDDGSATVTFPESGEAVPLTGFEQDESGAYLITGVQSSVTIGGITPRDRERIASDADEISGQEIVYNVEPGETRDGRLYYFDET
ncbi:MAG TPA: hypothetical protein VGR29_09010 [Thermomicrobiales bacterium]|nr:hypothetical protein [Thermomicrobiales bacterium]